MKQFFFITGLPRCRSAWLANYLTWKDSFCYHDGFVGHATIEGMIESLRQMPAFHVGNSDPANVFVWRQLAELCPDARWVVIRRPMIESIDSSSKAFGTDSSPVFFSFLQSEIDAITSKLNPLIVEYPELNPKEISDWIGIDAGGPDRLEMLNRLNVQVDKTVLNLERKRLVENPPSWLTLMLSDAA